MCLQCYWLMSIALSICLAVCLSYTSFTRSSNYRANVEQTLSEYRAIVSWTSQLVGPASSCKRGITIMRGKFVCLFVYLSCLSCLSYPSGAFCVARTRTPTAAFESLGLRYVRPHHLAPTSPWTVWGVLSCQIQRSGRARRTKTFLVHSYCG